MLRGIYRRRKLPDFISKVVVYAKVGRPVSKHHLLGKGEGQVVIFPRVPGAMMRLACSGSFPLISWIKGLEVGACLQSQLVGRSLRRESEVGSEF